MHTTVHPNICVFIYMFVYQKSVIEVTFNLPLLIRSLLFLAFIGCVNVCVCVCVCGGWYYIIILF